MVVTACSPLSGAPLTPVVQLHLGQAMGPGSSGVLS
jgi:hypothetical protein